MAGNTPTTRPNRGWALMDDPGILDTLETWETHLTDIEKMPPGASRDDAIKRAKTVIAEKKATRAKGALD